MANGPSCAEGKVHSVGEMGPGVGRNVGLSPDAEGRFERGSVVGLQAAPDGRSGEIGFRDGLLLRWQGLAETKVIMCREIGRLEPACSPRRTR